VLRLNSPGGSVTATDIMWRDLQNFKVRCQIPVIACLMDVGTGGAYYLATVADHIVAHPTTITGGIGVILNLYDLQDTMAQYNIVSTAIKSGERIDMGSPEREIGDESRRIMENAAAKFHQRFRDIVRQGRGLELPDDADIFDGRILTAEDALDHKLIDSIGYLDDALHAAELMGDCVGARVEIFHRCKDIARTPYAITPNQPVQGDFIPLSIPGLDRSRLPTFLYLWQPEPTGMP
jgi:protease-4